MNKILNPKKMIQDDVKCPTKEELLEAKKLICIELSDCRYQIKTFLKHKDLANYGRFIAVSCDSIFENLSAICHLGSNYLNQIFTLSRNYQEIIIDNFWLYDFFQNNPKIANDVSERFFYFGNRMLLNQIENNLAIMSVDLFFRDLVRNNFEKKKKELQEYISDYIWWGEKKFQQKDWRAHPKYFINNKDLKWEYRCNVAARIAKISVNFKNPPFKDNLSLLTSYVHWDPLQVDDSHNKNNELLFCRTLNILLGLAIDLLNLQYQIRNIDKKRPLNFVRAVNKIYYSSK